MSKKPIDEQATDPIEIPDFPSGTTDAILRSGDRRQILPRALVIAQADYALCRRKQHSVVIVTGSIDVPCSKCGEICLRALSTPERLAVICIQCYDALDSDDGEPDDCDLEPAKDEQDYNQTFAAIRTQLTDLQQRYQARLPMWVVFGPGTSDHPGLYLARLWLTLPWPENTEILIRAMTVEEIRDLLPPELTRMPRNPNDDANIIEVWV